MTIHPGLYLLLFFLELISLFFFSQLFIKAFSRLIYAITRRYETTVHTIAFFFLPGTIIHEMAHAITAGVMMVHVGNIEFTPEIRENSVKLGSAEIGQTDPFRRALIGIAPVLVGTALILGSLWFFTTQLSQSVSFPWWQILLLILLIFQVANTMFSSPKDLEGTLEVVALIGALFLAFYLLGFYQPFVWIDGLLRSGVGEFFKIASLFLLVPIGIDIAMYLLVKMFLGRRNLA